MGYKFKSSFYRKIILSGKLNVKMTPPWVLRVFRRARCHRYKYLFFNGKYSSPLAHFSKAKNKSMFAITRPSLLKSTDPKLFFCENLQKMIGDLSENFHVSLGTAGSCICLLKSLRFAEFICHIMWSRWFNVFVSDLSVVKNLTRFCLSVPYALCREYIYIYINIKKKKNMNVVFFDFIFGQTACWKWLYDVYLIASFRSKITYNVAALEMTLILLF